MSSPRPTGRRAGRAPFGPSLPRSFYERPTVVVARDLLGRILESRIGGLPTAGRIVETEAYLGPEDGASHAAFRPSSRALFYGPGGIAYVYRAYGLHFCLNAIAGSAGTPGCVLIRAVEPLAGLRAMVRRRSRPASARNGLRVPVESLTSGPARLTQALGITLAENGADLRRGRLTIRRGRGRPLNDIAVGPRVGITRSRELPLRFTLRQSRFVSRPRLS